MWSRDEQTICAVSTPAGVGGIAVIRISGSEALLISKKISNNLNKKTNIESHRVYFSDIHDLQNIKIDEAVITYFAQGKSFTGEEVVEISCHGSRYIAQRILDLLVESGCRLADKGEFTYRAFMNGNLDLTQAESVLALIESQNSASAKIALRQLGGQISKEIELLISDLTWCLAHIEASIDFAEQGIEVVDMGLLISKLKQIADKLGKLIVSYQSGKLLKDGIKVALIGEPNVGKSSLLNLLLQDDKAIVTPIAGTTRDVIEGTSVYNGIKFQISDTAGLRETSDQVEIIGIDKSKKEAESADILCFVLDCSQGNWSKALHLSSQLKSSKKVFLLNKADMLTAEQRADVIEKLKKHESAIFTSAHDAQSRDQIYTFILSSIGSLEFLDEAVISSSRQFESAKYSLEMIDKSILDLESNTGAEFVAMHLKEALVSLQKIVGQVYDDQILDRVFKEFCLGK